MSVEIAMLREMIRADLELAFDHLNADNEALAEYELRNALEKILQIKQVRQCSAVNRQPLLTLGPENGSTEPGT